jgi:PEP-CTERM motif
MKARLAALAAVLMFAATAAQSQVTLINEGFNNVTTLAGSGWIISNVSTPIGSTSWFQGDQQVFTSQAGAPEAYIAANFNSAAGGGTIADWLISPTFQTANAGTVSFYARADIADGFADHLKFGFSNGSSTLADFTLGAVQTIAGGWTQYTFAYGAQGAGSTARFAIVYTGLADLSNYVGIDTFSVVAVPEPETWALFALGLGGLGVVSRRRAARR